MMCIFSRPDPEFLGGRSRRHDIRPHQHRDYRRERRQVFHEHHRRQDGEERSPISGISAVLRKSTIAFGIVVNWCSGLSTRRLGLTLRSSGRCAIKPRSAPELER